MKIIGEIEIEGEKEVFAPKEASLNKRSRC